MQKKIRSARARFHGILSEKHIIHLYDNGVPSIADSHSRASTDIATEMISLMNKAGKTATERLPAQKAGNLFEASIAAFLRETLPIKWMITHDGSSVLSDFAQYEHLESLMTLSEKYPDLAASIGPDYMIRPDITVSRIVPNQEKPILHASISAKLTIRSDRAQNSRTEALNMIRNRKGHLPHIVVVTAESLPGRIASLALGTGDIDCVYHIALGELQEAVKQSGTEESMKQLDIMIKGKRLKDIEELPVDLI